MNLLHVPTPMKGLGLKWKQWIPFLFFALAGTFFLTYAIDLVLSP